MSINKIISIIMLLLVSTQSFALYDKALAHLKRSFAAPLTIEREKEIKKVMGDKIDYKKKFMEELQFYHSVKDYSSGFRDKETDLQVRYNTSMHPPLLVSVFMRYEELAGNNYSTNVKGNKVTAIYEPAYQKVLKSFKVQSTDVRSDSFFDIKLENVPKLMLDIMGQGDFQLVDHNTVKAGYKPEEYRDAAYNYMAQICYAFGVMTASARRDDRHAEFVEEWFKSLSKPYNVTRRAFTKHKSIALGYVKKGLEGYDNIFRKTVPLRSPKEISFEKISTYFNPGEFAKNREQVYLTEKEMVYNLGGFAQPRDIIVNPGDLLDKVHFFSLFYSGKDDQFVDWLNSSKPKGMNFQETVYETDNEDWFDDIEEPAEDVGMEVVDIGVPVDLSGGQKSVDPAGIVAPKEDAVDDFPPKGIIPKAPEGKEPPMPGPLLKTKAKPRKHKPVVANDPKPGKAASNKKKTGRVVMGATAAKLADLLQAGHLNLKNISDKVKVKGKKMTSVQQISLDQAISVALEGINIPDFEDLDDGSDNEWETVDVELREELEDDLGYDKAMQAKKLAPKKADAKKKAAELKKPKKKETAKEKRQKEEAIADAMNALTAKLAKIRSAVKTDEDDNLADSDEWSDEW